MSPGVKECILGDEPLARIHTIISEGRGAGGNGSQSFDQHIQELFSKGIISKETAIEAVEGQADFMRGLLVE